jgi:hypothetical protein
LKERAKPGEKPLIYTLEFSPFLCHTIFGGKSHTPMETSQTAAAGEKPLIYNTKKEKGDRAERLFLEHLNSQNIPFLFIDQDQNFYSKKMITNYVSRPDYIVYTLNGDFYVDVKYREKRIFSSKEDYRFPLYHEEIDKLFNFQKIYNLIVWVAFTDNLSAPNFFYAPILKIYEYRKFIITELEKKCLYELKNKINSCHTYIPESFLYNSISYEKGFHNEADYNFPKNDIEWYEFGILQR